MTMIFPEPLRQAGVRALSDAAHWLDEKYAAISESVNTRLCSLGLPSGGDASGAKVAEILRDFHGGGAAFYKAYAKAYINGTAVPAIIWHQRKRAIKEGELSIGMENAELSGLMLSMYLEQKINPDLINRVQKSVARSDNFEWLVAYTEQHVQAALGSGSGPPSPADLQREAQKAFDLARSPDSSGGANFKFSMEGLKPIIEGIGGLDAVSAQIEPAGFFSGKDDVSYTVLVRIRDTYKFFNERRSADPKSGALRENQYTLYRNLLRDLLSAQRFTEFELAYARGMCQAPLSGGTVDHIDKSLVFASYMFALEGAGYFTGLPWFIEIRTRPMNLTRTGANPAGPANWPADHGGSGRRW